MWNACIPWLFAALLTPPPGPTIVTEEGFLAPFREGHDAVTALAGDRARAEAERARAGLVTNPRIDFWREAPEDNPRVTNWTIAWTPPWNGRRALGRQAADAGVAAAGERLLVSRAQLRREAREIFAAWSLSFERRARLGQGLEQIAPLAERERRRAAAGEASGLAAGRLELAAGEVRRALAEADANLALAEAVARAWRADLPAEARPAPAALEEPPESLDPAASPELRALAEEARQAGLEARRAGRFWDLPAIQVGWQEISQDGGDDGGPIYAASWPLPLSDRNQAGRLEADRRLEISESRILIAQARQAGALQGTLAAYRTLRAAALEAAGTASGTKGLIASAAAAFDAGESGLTDLLETHRSCLEAMLGEIEARARALEAHRRLEELAGRPLLPMGDGR